MKKSLLGLPGIDQDDGLGLPCGFIPAHAVGVSMHTAVRSPPWSVANGLGSEWKDERSQQRLSVALSSKTMSHPAPPSSERNGVVVSAYALLARHNEGWRF